MEAAKARITAKSLFIVHIVHGRLEGAMNFSYDAVIWAELSDQYQEEAKSGWCLSDDSTKELWEAQSRWKISIQPGIKELIIQALKQNMSKSYAQISEETGNWCY